MPRFSSTAVTAWSKPVDLPLAGSNSMSLLSRVEYILSFAADKCVVVPGENLPYENASNETR